MESHLEAQFRPGHRTTRVGWGRGTICIFFRCYNGFVIDLLGVDFEEGFFDLLDSVLLVMMEI